jgi:hypothetical protein
LSVLVAVLVVVLVAAVVIVVSAPLRASRVRARVSRHDDLEAERDAKYREIRDAELDYRTGKLSREDYEAIDGELRAEAIQILDRIEAEER